MEEVKELTEKIELLENIINKLKVKKLNNELEELEVVFKLLSLELELKEAKKDLKFAIGPDYTDGEIDLYLNPNYKCMYYDIYLAGTRTRVGEIEYRPSSVYHDDGDIGYKIQSSYRGNHYALKALKLIRNKIIELGVNVFDIYAYDFNKPSIKTIEAFGGEKYFDNGEYSKFRCSV